MSKNARSRVGMLAIALALFAGGSGAAAQHAEPGAVFTGAWDVTFGSQMGEMTLRFDVESDGGTISGVAVSEVGEAVVEGMQDGQDVAFTVFIDQPDHQVELVFSGTIEGDAGEGVVDIMGEAYDWTAKRVEGRH